MIDLNLNIALLEMFDSLNEEEDTIKYLEYKQTCLKDQTIIKLVEQYNELQSQMINIDYKPYLIELETKVALIESKLNDNEHYQKYLTYEKILEERVTKLSQLVFLDIVSVGFKGCACASK